MRYLPLLALLLCLAAHADFSVVSSSFLGGEGDADAITGAAIQADGTLVFAGSFSLSLGPSLKAETTPEQQNQPGGVLRLAPDGKRLVTLHRLAASVPDFATDAADALYVAADSSVIKLRPAADRVVWRADLGGVCSRVDAASDGHSVALVGRNTLVVLSPEGKEISRISVGRGWEDVAIHGPSATVFGIGFRNDNAFDGKQLYPVQISYLKAFAYDGTLKWSAYDWDTVRDSPRFINRSENNMADTRGYRCAIGADGLLYTAFEAAGGNHIFRYTPYDIMQKQPIVGGGPYHLFYGGSGAAHRTIFMRFVPATGDLLKVQQWTPRTAAGRCGNLRIKNGAITADSAGRFFLVGRADPLLPLTFDPCPPEEPKGGPHILIMDADFKNRLLVTRMQYPGLAQCVATRVAGDRQVVVYAGAGAKEGMHTLDALQPAPIGQDAFFVILTEQRPTVG